MQTHAYGISYRYKGKVYRTVVEGYDRESAVEAFKAENEHVEEE